MSNHDEPIDRRRFFRAALNELLKPLEQKAAPLRRALNEFSARQAQPAPGGPDVPVVRPPAGRTAARGADPFGINAYPPGSWEAEHGGPGSDGAAGPPPAYLRPPGAQPEERFRELCTRCGECVEVCPARCIKVEPDGRGDGFPFIAVDEMPCVLCDGLLCMPKCPTGALAPTPMRDVDMGTAVWHESTCVRSRREECTTCVDQCPLGSDAIELRDGKVHVIEDGCTGCGVCEHFCPTGPRSITVTPRGAATAV